MLSKIYLIRLLLQNRFGSWLLPFKFTLCCKKFADLHLGSFTSNHFSSYYFQLYIRYPLACLIEKIVVILDTPPLWLNWLRSEKGFSFQNLAILVLRKTLFQYRPIPKIPFQNYKIQKKSVTLLKKV